MNSSTANREELLSTLEKTIDDVQDQIATQETETLKEERMQIRWCRTLGYLAGQHRKLSNDTDLDTMKDDLALLKDITGSEDDR